MPGTATRAVERAPPTPSLGQRASVIFPDYGQKVLTKSFPFISVNGYPKNANCSGIGAWDWVLLS